MNLRFLLVSTRINEERSLFMRRSRTFSRYRHQILLRITDSYYLEMLVFLGMHGCSLCYRCGTYIRRVYKLPGDYYSYGQHFNVATPAAES